MDFQWISIWQAKKEQKKTTKMKKLNLPSSRVRAICELDGFPSTVL